MNVQPYPELRFSSIEQWEQYCKTLDANDSVIPFIRSGDEIHVNPEYTNAPYRSELQFPHRSNDLNKTLNPDGHAQAVPSNAGDGGIMDQENKKMTHSNIPELRFASVLQWQMYVTSGSVHYSVPPFVRDGDEIKANPEYEDARYCQRLVFTDRSKEP